MAWEMHVFFLRTGTISPLEVTVVPYGEPRPTNSDWFPPQDPPWGERGGQYHFVWYQNGLVEVPDVRGKTRQAAEALLQDLNVQVQLRNSADTPSNEVISQDVPERALVAQGSTISLEVAR